MIPLSSYIFPLLPWIIPTLSSKNNWASVCQNIPSDPGSHCQCRPLLTVENICKNRREILGRFHLNVRNYLSNKTLRKFGCHINFIPWTAIPWKYIHICAYIQYKILENVMSLRLVSGEFLCSQKKIQIMKTSQFWFYQL